MEEEKARRNVKGHKKKKRGEGEEGQSRGKQKKLGGQQRRPVYRKSDVIMKRKSWVVCWQRGLV